MSVTLLIWATDTMGKDSTNITESLVPRLLLIYELQIEKWTGSFKTTNCSAINLRTSHPIHATIVIA